MDASLNPMMPKRQLPRSPIHVDGTTISQQSKRFSPPPEKGKSPYKYSDCWEKKFLFIAINTFIFFSYLISLIAHSNSFGLKKKK